jgi:tetratricopeptide (TPR) repeat protein
MLHLHLHDDALAERYYREAMKLDLRSSNIIIEYANFLNTSGNPGKAEHYFAMACKVAPFDPNAQLAFALYLKEMKKYDRARGAFEKVTTNIVVFCLDHTYPILHSGHVVFLQVCIVSMLCSSKKSPRTWTVPRSITFSRARRRLRTRRSSSV